MSHITDVVIWDGGYQNDDEPEDDWEEIRLAEINAFDHPALGKGNCKLFGRVDGAARGTKVFGPTLYAGAINYLNIPAFLEHLRTKVRWGHAPYGEDHHQTRARRSADDDRPHRTGTR